MAGERRPVPAAVGRREEAAAGAVGGGRDVPGGAPGRPEGGVDHLGVAGLESEVDGAGVLVLVEDLLPALAAVARAEDAALGARAVGVPPRRHEADRRTARSDQPAR